MSIERTLSMIKPDGVEAGLIGEIYTRFTQADLKIVAAQMMRLTRQQAEDFYRVHEARPFFKDLVDFIISGPVMVQVLEGEDAIARYRTLMGATDPTVADKGTLRGDLAESINKNLVHGSDSSETACKEVAFLFPGVSLR